MLGFGAVTETVPAGGPATGASTVYVIVATAPTLEILANVADLYASRALLGAPAIISIAGSGAVGKQRTLRVNGAEIQLLPSTARLYKSAYFMGDAEIARVPAEASAARVPFEPRTVAVYGDRELMTTEDQDESLAPRLRRT